MNKLKLILQYNILFVIILIFLIIYVIIFTKIISYKSIYDINNTEIEGTITSYSINGNSLKLDVKSSETVKVSYYIKSEEEKEYLLKNIVLGSTIYLKGTFSEPINNTIPNTFNYKEYLYNMKIFYTFKVDSYKLTKNNNFLYKIKDYLIKRIYNMEDNDYLLIFILGDKSLINNEEYSSFQLNGTAHLLAISGMHIGVLLIFFNKILKNVGKRKKIIILSLILLFFGFLTSFSASICRVIVFFILMNINKVTGNRFSNLQILFLTGTILVLINPFIVYNYGFLYSLIITGGILYYSDKIKGNYLSTLLKLSIISFLFSLPITALLNYEINLTSVIANLIFVPLVSFVIYPWSLFTLIIPNSIWPWLINILNILNNIFKEISLVINIPKIPLVLIIVYYIFLILFKNNKKFILGLISIIFINKIINTLDSNYYIYFLDIGQGDCSVLISPYKKEVVMIDTGGKIAYEQVPWEKSSKTYNLSDNSIKFLKSLGITKLDYLIISHGDMDHSGETLNIINNLKVKNIILNKGDYNNIEQVIINSKINITNEYNLKYFLIYSLNDKLYDNENDNSIINYISIYDYNFLFLGDASIKVEEDVLSKYNLDIDIVKLGHHGSKTSSSQSLLDLTWDYGIISSGRNNRYNHPSKEVIESLDKYNKKYYNTQVNGTIRFKINKRAYTIKTWDP